MEQTRKPRRVALFVGVDEYEDTSIPTLSGAVADARALHVFFASRPNQFDMSVLLENPTCGDVFKKVVELSSELCEGDLFLFYFAGHGMDDGGKQKLLCSDTIQGKRCLVNEFDLRHVAGNEKWNVAVILDACRTKLDATRGMEARVGERRDLDFYDGLVKSRNADDASLAVLFSCDEGKTAGEVKGRGHGLFSLALLDVLERADKKGRGWCFDQNLGDEIGKTMQRLADNDSGQRPWIKASGTPPLFFLPSMDVQPLIDWTVAFQKAGWLSVDESAECQKAFTSPNNRAKGLYETIRFFSQWGRMRENEAAPDETASAIIRAICATIDEVDGLRRKVEELNKALREAPLAAVGDDARNSQPSASAESQALSQTEAKMLNDFLDKAVRPNWRDVSQEARGIRDAKTVPEAVAALDALVSGILTSLGKNNNIVAWEPGTRRHSSLLSYADPFLDDGNKVTDFERSSRLWNDTAPISAVKAAMRRVFLAAKLLQRWRT